MKEILVKLWKFFKRFGSLLWCYLMLLACYAALGVLGVLEKCVDMLINMDKSRTIRKKVNSDDTGQDTTEMVKV